ncbi:MAG: M61 family metallopeptidase [Alphaproteobacteria bacterium]|nr:M61 family metallopeptidase [Alphaproteobacteria bacterium]
MLWLVGRVVGALVACGAPEPAATPVVVAPEPPGIAPDQARVRYALDLSRRDRQLLDVTAVARTGGADTLVWMMPVWTPGSYLVREYARHVEQVRAVGADGASLPVRKVAKNRWEVATAGQAEVTLRYAVWADEPSVRTNLVEPDLAVLVGAATFLVPVDAQAAPLEVVLDLPEDWQVATALPPHPDGAEAHWLVPDFDTLVDGPLIAGHLQVGTVQAAGVPHTLADLVVEGTWDHERALADVGRVAGTVAGFWGEVPYRSYLFLHGVGLGGGGLEHLDSTLLMSGVGVADDDDRYRRWLGLVAHEHFHAWNVKRLRPVGLGPFDYEREVHTPSLWIAEGWTSYYDDLLLVRGGLIDGDTHLARLSESISAVQGRPGRLRQSLAEAGFDAWIEHYRPDARSPSTSISYYTKGLLVAWLLDARIREATRDLAGLDEVARRLWSRFRDEGYTPEDVRAVVAEVAGRDLGSFFDAYVEGTEELDYAPALAWFGLRWRAVDPPDPVPGWLGVQAGGSPWRVETVLDGTPAAQAGLLVDDELLALDDTRVDAASWDRLRRHHPPGTEATLLVARHGRLVRLPVTFGEAPAARWTLERDPRAPVAAVHHRQRWWAAR